MAAVHGQVLPANDGPHRVGLDRRRGPGAPRPDEHVREVALAGGGLRRERRDLLGRPTLLEEPDGSWLRLRYRADGRLKSVEHASGERIEFEADPTGRVWRARTAEVETTLHLADDGHPTAVETTVDGRRWALGYQRDERGQATAWEYPDAADWLRQERSADGGLVLRCGAQTYCRVAPDGSAATTTYATGARVREELTAEAPHRLVAVRIEDAGGRPVVDAALRYGPRGRLTDVGGHRYAYDQDGRLIEAADDAVSAGGEHAYTYAYDAAGRLIERRGPRGRTVLGYEHPPTVARVETDDGERVRFVYDPLGRRVERHDRTGVTRYRYNLLGLLAAVERPDGPVVEYLYDGFGRLVRRRAGRDTTYYVVGLEGERRADLDAEGRVRASYLWLGPQCVGRIDGPLGGPLAATFHRVHAGWLAAVGDAGGTLRALDHGEPFGAGAPPVADRPGYAGLFGDPATGLLLAGTRWLDPSVAQFLTPDTWFGVDPVRGLPPRLRAAVRALPGGTARLFTPTTAYAWSAYDPVNFSDPSGHNWVGLIFSVISSVLWEVQLTSVALQMEAINIFLEPLNWLINGLFRSSASLAWKWSVANLSLPAASYRLMVPYSFWLNGFLKIHDGRAWTLGSIVWERGSELREIEELSHRDVLVCSNAAAYVARSQQVVADRFRARNPNVQLTGTVAAGGTTVNVGTVVAPAGVALGDLIAGSDWVSVRLLGAPTDEVREVVSVSAAASTIDLAAPPLPAAFVGGTPPPTVEVVRLDRAFLTLTAGGKTVTRTVQFSQGTSFHFTRQVPKGLKTSGIEVKEFVPTGRPNVQRANCNDEAVVVRLAKATELAGYAATNVVRIHGAPKGAPAGTSPFAARVVAATRNRTDLVLDAALAAGTYGAVEVVRLDPTGTAVTGQSVPTAPGGAAIPDQVGITGLNDLRERDGLEIRDATAPDHQRRIVTKLLLDCTVAALPAALHGVRVTGDRLAPTGRVADGAMQGSGLEVKVTTTGARFDARKPVVVTRKDNGRRGVGIAASFAAGILRLDEALPLADFADGVDVTVQPLAATSTLKLRNVAAPGDHLVVEVDRPNLLAANEIVRVRPNGARDGGAARILATAPAQLAQLDSALPASHRANLDVQRLAPVDATRRSKATVPKLRPRLQIIGTPAVPFAVGDRIHVRGSNGDDEEMLVEVAAVTGSDVVLAQPIELLPQTTLTSPVRCQTVIATGSQTADGQLTEGMVLIPSEDDGELSTRRRALREHEMRHVWQGAVWGPFLLSLPLPWLAEVGFSFSRLGTSQAQIARHLSLGTGLDSLLALVAWGAGTGTSKLFGGEGIESFTAAARVVGADRKRLVFDAAVAAGDVERFDAGAFITVSRGSDEATNVVDRLETATRTIELRFALGSPFNADDAVRVYISPFERLRQKISGFFGLNLSQLWRDKIPDGWGQALSRLLDRESWFPFIGIYFLGLLQVGSKEFRLPNEQDAAYHSGDLYTDLAKAEPNEIFVGQFTRVWAYIQARYGGLAQLSSPAGILRVALPSGVTAEQVPGAVPAGPDPTLTGTGGAHLDTVRFRESHLLELPDPVENAVGALFTTARAGTYHVRPPDTDLYDSSLAFPKFAFAVGFFDLAKITVKPLGITPNPATPIFETDTVLFAIAGDRTASYALRFPAGAPTPLGALSGLRYTAPALPSGTATASQVVEVTASYPDDHAIFFIGSGRDRRRVKQLRPELRTNLAQAVTLTINALPTPSFGPLAAGAAHTFSVPIAPATARIMSPLPAGAARNARVTVVATGRPARIEFVAPNAVAAATPISVELTFGADPANRKVVTFQVQVTP